MFNTPKSKLLGTIALVVALLLVIVVVVFVVPKGPAKEFNANSLVPRRTIRVSPPGIPVADMEKEKGTEKYYTYDLEYPRSSPTVLPDIYKFVQAAKGDVTTMDAPVNGFKYVVIMTTRVETSPETVSYIIETYEDTGGAHGNTFDTTFTYDAQGKLLSLQDVLKGTDIYTKLSQKARAYFYSQFTQGETSHEGIDMGTTPKPENFSTWYVKGDDVVFIFGQYSIGPYVLGIQEFPLVGGRINPL